MEIEFVLIAVTAILQVITGAPPMVEVSQSKMIVLENHRMTAVCRVGRSISFCRFYLPQLGGFILSPSIPPEKGIQYYGAGLDRGECGISISNVGKVHNGPITCHLGYSNESQESTGKMQLVVAQPPQTPRLTLRPGLRGTSFEEGEKVQADCRIEGGRPVANISWFLGTEPITEGLSSPSYEPGPDGSQTVSQSLTFPVKYTDHGKNLRCVANHIALGPANINHSIHKLTINFPPKPKSSETEQFGFTIGQPGKVIVMFNANPKPNIHWEVGKEKLAEGMKDSSRNFEASVLQPKGSGTWAAVLNIAKVTASDVEKKYTLVAENELGRESYKVAISTSPAPPADITGGAIAGIVIVVLVILLIIFILIFARAFGKWCFAAGANGNKSSSEVAIEDGTDEKRPPSIQGKDGVYSSTEYINGGKARRQTGESKSALAKIGSLTYKDYKPIKTEDGKKIYVSPEDEKKIILASRINEMDMRNEVESKRLESSDSDSAYEIPVKCKSESGIEREPGETFESEAGAATSPRKFRYTFPFNSRKSRRLFPEAEGAPARVSLPERPTDEEIEEGLKLPPHMRRVEEEDEKNNWRSLNSKFSRLFRRVVPEPGGKGEDFRNAGAAPDPSNEQIPIEITYENERRSEPSVSAVSPGGDSLGSGARGEGERRKSNSRITMRSIFGIESEKPLPGRERSKGDVRSIEGKRMEGEISEISEAPRADYPKTTGVDDDGEEREANDDGIKFPTNIPLRNRWGPRSRKSKARSAPDTEINDNEDLKRNEKIEGILSTRFKKNKKARPVSFAEEPIVFDIRSDTESADHGSTDKSSVSKLTEEKQQKRFLGQLLDSIKRKNKEKIPDNEALRNMPLTTDKDIAQQIQKDQIQNDHLKTEGIVYAELDMARSQGNVVRRDDEKTEYAEIIHPKLNENQRSRDELRKSRENLSSSRENLTDGEGTTLTPDGKKEAAV